MSGAMQALLDAFLVENPRVPGVIVAVEAPSTGSWAGAAGLAEVATGAHMRPNLTFRIASNTKTFTAATVLRLVEQGKVSLDDRIAEYFPSDLVDRLNVVDGVSRGHGITIRHLLNHTSGLYDWGTDADYAALGGLEPSKRWTPLEQVEFALAHGDPYGAPGELVHYSDTGYVLASLIIEQVSGLPLAAAFRSLLRFETLGLASTYLESLEPVPAAAAPRIHQYLGSRDGNGIDASFDLFGGGGLVSSAADLVRFWRALFGGRVFDDPRTLDLMLTTVPAGEGRGDAGLGLFHGLSGDIMCWRHSGFWGSFALHVPERDITIAGVANQQKAHDSGAIVAFAARLLGSLASAG
jgi:D-alanyl-D-alanine carboxypeptidase